MDPIPIVDVRSGIASIVQEFSDALNLFQKWRKSRAGRKGVGQEECETSLEEGKTIIEERLKKCLRQHGRRFGQGDNRCRDGLKDCRAKFHTDVHEVLSRSVAGKLSKAEKIDPLELIKAIESTRKETILAMDELSSRITDGTSAPLTMTDPEDVLPPMPLPHTRVPQAPGISFVPGQLPVTSSLLKRDDSSSNPALLPSQTSRHSPPGRLLPANPYLGSFGRPVAPISQRPYTQPSSSWTLPDFANSQALTRIVPSTSATANAAMSWMKDKFPPKPVRQYYDDITPLKPTPAVVPTFVCNIDAEDILKAGARAAQNFWAAAEYDENQRLREHAHSAPLPQEPWKEGFFGDDGDDDDGLMTPTYLLQREGTPAPEESMTPMFLKPVPPVGRPSSVQGQRRIRSQPILEFSVVTPRIRRHISNPESQTR